MKRLISAALCLALALGLMAGCGSLEDVDLGVSAAPENTGAGDASSLQLDWDAARAKHELDATVLTSPWTARTPTGASSSIGSITATPTT